MQLLLQYLLINFEISFTLSIQIQGQGYFLSSVGGIPIFFGRSEKSEKNCHGLTFFDVTGMFENRKMVIVSKGQVDRIL